MDWLQNPAATDGAFTSRKTFDALNRPLTVTSPDQSVYRPTFNEANLLDKVDVHLRGAAAGTAFVTNIDYNAKAPLMRIVQGAAGGAAAAGATDVTVQSVELLTGAREEISADQTASSMAQGALWGAAGVAAGEVARKLVPVAKNGGGDLKGTLKEETGAVGDVAGVRRAAATSGEKASATAARGASSLDDLSRAAGAAERGGLTAAGRALQKHGGRPGGAFPAARVNPAQINQAGQGIVDDILTSPGSTTTTRHHARFGDVTEIRAPDGRGVRYDANGGFIGFLEP